VICSSIQHEVDHSMPSTRSGNWRCKESSYVPSNYVLRTCTEICIENNLNLGCEIEIEIKFDFELNLHPNLDNLNLNLLQGHDTAA
jgi:hypothetical protein